MKNKDAKSVADLLDFWAREKPEGMAYAFLPGKDGEERALTYRALRDATTALGSRLAGMIPRQGRALLLFQPGLEFLKGFYACMSSDLVAVPMAPIKPGRHSEALRNILSNCAPGLVLTERRYYTRLMENPGIRSALADLPAVFVEESDSGPDCDRPRAPTADSLAFLQYTSGATSAPKGVMVRHGNIMANLRNVDTGFGMHDGTIFMGWLPLFHDMGLLGKVLQPLYRANPSYLTSPMNFLTDPVSWLRMVSRFGATVSGGPNFAYDLCCDAITPEGKAGLDLSRWENAFNGSEPVKASTLRRFTAEFADCGFRPEAFYPCYGMAEATLFTSGKPVLTPTQVKVARKTGQASKEFVGCGRTWLDQVARIVDPETRAVCPDGTEGEIWIQGANVCDGYWNNPSANEAAFGELPPEAGKAKAGGRFLRTGDLGFMEAGEIFVTGRRKEVIIIRGANFYPQDLEETAQRSDDAFVVHGGAAFTVQEGERETVVLAQEVKRTTPVKDYPLLIERARMALIESHGFAPDAIVLLRQASCPVTTSGKIQRALCSRLFQEGGLKVLADSRILGPAQVPEAHSIPGPEFQEVREFIIAAIAAKANLPPASIDAGQGFSRYGLDSVASVRLVGSLEERFGCRIEPTVLWEYNSIDALSRHIASGAGKAAGAAQPLPCDCAPADPGVSAPPVPEPAPAAAPGPKPTDGDRTARFSLMFFSSDASRIQEGRYALVLEASRLAERCGFASIWVPERHFHEFGGLFPSASVMCSALAQATTSIRLRAGSVVLPLNNPIRVAEEWAMLDNLSGGRVDLGFAQGWNANDFVLAPGGYAGRKDAMFADIELIRSLWRGETATLPNGKGEATAVSIFPLPMQSAMIPWITCSGGKERFEEAGSRGYNVLTALLFQTAEELEEKIAAYRRARERAGFDPAAGQVTLMLHTYIHPDPSHAIVDVKEPFLRYLESSVSLWRQESADLDSLSPTERRATLQVAFERYARTSALFTTPDGARRRLREFRGLGVDEIACLMDFGLTREQMLASIGRLAEPAAAPEPAPDATGEDIAIVGIGVRFPGARTPDEFWSNLVDGKNFVRPMPPGRWPGIGGPDSPFLGGFLDDVDAFDSEFFRISPREAACMDPQQRLYLETAWKCLQDAGYPAEALEGTRTGVFVGAAEGQYLDLLQRCGTSYDAHMLAGNTVCTLPARVSYFLDLKGPSISLDTACSSSLVAIHNACRSILSGESEAALAGGVSCLLSPHLYHIAGKANMLSPTGQCHTFAAEADGYIPGEGAACLYLKRISHAQRDQDHVYAVIRASSLNQDGRSNGITAPSMDAQAAVERDCLRQAGIAADEIDFVECHGTGTPLGDPVEIKALKAAYSLSGRKHPLRIGSVKSNLGHLLAAAGIAGVIKAALCLKHRAFVPSVNFRAPNPLLALEDGNLRVCRTPARWEKSGRRFAAVSGFGHSGTNCHMILAEAPPAAVSPKPRKAADSGSPAWITCSAPDPERLAAYLAALSRRLSDGSPALESVASVLRLSRSAFAHRFACRAASLEDLQTEIELALQAVSIPDHCLRRCGEASDEGAERDAIVAYLRGASDGLSGSADPAPKISLPPLPLAAVRHWPGLDALPGAPADPAVRAESPSRTDSPAETGPVTAPTPVRARGYDETVSELREMIRGFLGMEGEVDIHVPFLEMGADSLVLMDAVQLMEKKFGVKVPVSDLFERLSDVDKLARHLADAKPAIPPAAPPAAPAAPARQPALPETPDAGSLLPAWSRPSADTAAGEAGTQELAEAYVARTAASKRFAETNRPLLADNRASAGFRPSIKEMLYPIVADRGQGAWIWDLDGNEYLDITMGFGVHLLGHNPPGIRRALREEIDRGFLLGPQSPHAGAVARAICGFTGAERAAFFNSGTEAVMSAMRLCRAFTGKPAIALFAGSYHGHSDGTLGHPDGESTRPAVAGVNAGSVADTVILEYGSDACFQRLEAIKHGLAAVLVEPVQARNPGFQPFDFLARLRDWTARNGVLLVFDEMIVGFRIALGGMQEHLALRADLCVYGKVVGGGMPIGVVAGRAEVLDYIDGGQWKYGDRSGPSGRTTFVAGTFSKHPLAMAAAQETLRYLGEKGKSLYDDLNRRAADTCAELNAIFAETRLPVETRNFGSLFRFHCTQNQDLFFYRLVHEGVYIWEGRNCFLSTEHGDKEIRHLLDAVRSAAGPNRPKPVRRLPVPMLLSQRQIWTLSKLDLKRFSSYNECHAFRVEGELDAAALALAIGDLHDRHESLRFRLDEAGECLVPSGMAAAFAVEERHGTSDEELIRDERRHIFNLVDGPLAYFKLFRTGPGKALFLAHFHHLIVDGWSLGLVIAELAEAYGRRRGTPRPAPSRPAQFRDFVRHQSAFLESGERAASARGFWLASLEGYEAFSLSGLAPDASVPHSGRRDIFAIDAEWCGELERFCKAHSLTLFSALYAAYLAVLHNLSDREELVTGVPATARTFPGSGTIVGFLAHLLPLRSRLQGGTTWMRHLVGTRNRVAQALQYQDFPYAHILRERNARAPGGGRGLVNQEFNVDSSPVRFDLQDCRCEPVQVPYHSSDSDLSLSVNTSAAPFQATLQYRTDLMGAGMAARFRDGYLKAIREMLDGPQEPMSFAWIDTEKSRQGAQRRRPKTTVLN